VKPCTGSGREGHLALATGWAREAPFTSCESKIFGRLLLDRTVSLTKASLTTMPPLPIVQSETQAPRTTALLSPRLLQTCPPNTALPTHPYPLSPPLHPLPTIIPLPCSPSRPPGLPPAERLDSTRSTLISLLAHLLDLPSPPSEHLLLP
jgi:hypothetical protein